MARDMSGGSLFSTEAIIFRWAGRMVIQTLAVIIVPKTAPICIMAALELNKRSKPEKRAMIKIKEIMDPTISLVPSGEFHKR